MTNIRLKIASQSPLTFVQDLIFTSSKYITIGNIRNNSHVCEILQGHSSITTAIQCTVIIPSIQQQLPREERLKSLFHFIKFSL